MMFCVVLLLGVLFIFMVCLLWILNSSILLSLWWFGLLVVRFELFIVCMVIYLLFGEIVMFFGSDGIVRYWIVWNGMCDMLISVIELVLFVSVLE